MKKIILLLVACMLNGILLANHWEPVDPGLYSNATTIIGVIQINGEEQYTDQLELGVFCGDECRGTGFPEVFTLTNRFLVNVNVHGENEEELTFRLYDHNMGMELDFTPPASVIFNDNGYGTPIEPYELNFTGEISHVSPNPIVMGLRPNNAWMRPVTIQIYNAGNFSTINSISTDNPFFQIEEVEMPFTIGLNQTRELSLTSGSGEGEEEGHLIINYRDNETMQYDLSAVAYDPAVKDVWELAYEVTEFPFADTLVTADIPLYNNYELPPAETEDGADAVYKLVFDQDVLLNASVTNGENGKMALYTEDFNGEGGPMATNYFIDLNAAGAAAEPFEVQIGEGTSTSGYFPFYCFYNYSLSQQLFTADELTQAGVTSAPMTSLSWYCTSSNGNLQSNITIWMGNVEETAMTSTTMLTVNMDKVYEGNMTPVANEWNEFVFNQGSFSWDGHSNILVSVQRNNGAWASGINWQVGAQNFTCSVYKYTDSTGAGYGPFDMTTNSYSGSTSTNRANIIMKGGSRDRNRDLIDFEDGLLPADWTYYGANGSWYVGSQDYWGYAPAYAGSYSLYIDGSGAYGDDYFVSPALEFAGAGAVSFAYATKDWSGDQNDLTVAYSTSPTGPWSYTSFSHQTSNSWTTANVDLSALNGTYYIAFISYDGYGYSTAIDNINITGAISGGGGGNGGNDGITVPHGTYYLVASSTSDEWSIEINTDTLSCPVMASNPTPANYNTVSPTAVQLQWVLGNWTTEYKLLFGEDPNNMTAIVDWTRDLAESYLLTSLLNNTNYYWQIVERNDGCPEGVEGPVWSFYTQLNAPNLYYDNDYLFEGDELLLSWNPIADTGIIAYNIYQDDELIGSTTDNTFAVTNFVYNMDGYNFYLTAQYAAGGSNPSNMVTVWVSGYGDVEGYVYEQDGETGIAGAIVTLEGQNEFGTTVTFNFMTDEQGYYTAHIYAGTYYGSAAYDGYQSAEEPVQGNPINLSYNELVSPIDYILNENYDPVPRVIAEYYPDAEDLNSPYVKVYEGGYNDILFDFEDSDMHGWTAIDADGDGYNWRVASSVMSLGQGHNGSNDCVLSQSWYQSVVLYPDNYLVSPMVRLGGFVTFYACAQDAGYAAEHFGVAVSTTDTNPSSFTMLNEWTMTAKGEGAKTGFTRVGGNRSQGNWYQYTVDLSAYSGMGYVAIRHFNCSDMFYLDIDDIIIHGPDRVEPNRAFSHYRYYRTDAYNDGPYTVENTVVIADNMTDSEFIDLTWEDAEPGVYKFGMSCVYEGNRDGGNREIVEIGDGTGTTYYFPIDNYFNYSCTEQIYTADEIGVEGTINSISFYYNYGTAYTSSNVRMYMKNVSRSQFESTADYEPIAESDLVWYGDIAPAAEGWYTINLDTPFAYDGTSNLLVAFYDGTSGYPGTSFTWRQTTSPNSANMALRYYSDSYSPDPYDLGSFSGSRSLYTYRGNVQLNIEPSVASVQGERESVIVWSNALDKNMYLTNGDVNITVALNSGDSPEGVLVSFINLNPNEQELYPIDNVVLDATGYYAWDNFRCGDYLLLIDFDGYATIVEEVSIWEPADLNYVLEEIAYTISNLYVSSTGWAMWNDDLNGNELPLLDSGRHFEQYQVVLTDSEDVVIYEDIITNHYLQLPVENLVEGETYRLKVASEYSSGLSEWYVVDWVYQSCNNFEGLSNLTAEFNDESNTLSWNYPEAEGVSYDVQIGDGTGIVSNAPINDYNGYSLTQQLYRASELEGMGAVAGPISSIGWSRYNPYDYHFTHHIKIWMANVTDNAVSSNSLDVNTMTLVYDDEYTVIRDWNMFNIASFAWDGVSNLLIVVATDAIGVFNSNQASWWRVTQTDYISSRSLSSSNTPFYPETQTYSFNNYSYNRPNLRIVAKQKAPMGAMVYREGEFLGFSQESSYTDTQFTGNHEYEIRVVYDGSAGLPNNNVYFSMSCPQTIGGATYEVTVAAEPEECGVVSGAGSYINGFPCTLTATANTGYQFLNWTINGEEVSTELTYTFIVHEDATCVAHFSNSQSIPLVTGWNWISSYVEMNGMDALGMLEESLGDDGVQIQSQEDYVVNYGGFWMGMLESLVNEETYMVQTLADKTVVFYGPLAQPSDHPITINQGWNWIGYPVIEAMSVDEAFADFMPADGDELKAQGDYAVYYSGFGWMGELNTIMPGMGLLYHAANSGTFTYPDSSRGGELAENGNKDGNHWTNNIHAYATNMTMLAVVELDDEELQSDRYELAAFADGEVRGSAKLMYVQPIDRYVAFLTIAGDEPVELHFGLYNEMTGEEIFDCDDHLTYTTNAIVGIPNAPAVVRFRGTTGQDDIERNLHVYPNPVARGERISLNLPLGSEVSVETVNAFGVVVNVETSTKAPAIIKAPETSGIYTLRITVDGKGTYTRKLIVR